MTPEAVRHAGRPNQVGNLGMRPPWASTMPLQMASPRPDPPISRPRSSPSSRENLRNRCGSRSAGTPTPSSATEKATWTPSGTAVTRMGDSSFEWWAALESRLPSAWTMRRRSAMTLGRSGGRSMTRLLLPPPLWNLLLASSTRTPASMRDGPKERPTLEPDEDAALVVKRIFDLAESRKGMLKIVRILNDDGIASPRGKLWNKPTVHNILRNEAYLGTLVWGNNAKDNADPVRVEKAFPATVTKAQFDRVNRIMRSRAPRVSHPRRVGSTFLLSGLVKCYRCKRALSGRYSSRGTFPYHVCHSFVKRAPGSCDSLRVDARKFEELVVGLIRSNILTEGNIRSLVNVVGEQMDDVAGEERKRLETIESELADVRGRLDRLYDLVETTTEFNMADFAHRIRDHKERQERLESAAEGARAILVQRRVVLDDVKTITAYAQDMNRFLQKSELTERRAFIETFVREIELLPDNAVVRYTKTILSDVPS